VLDGHPLAKRGEAGRAFGAGYAASLFGGIFGALLLAVSIPILRPIMLYIGSPELLALTVFGLSMVAVLSGRTPLRGLAAAAVGLMVAMIGSGPQTGALRWTFDSLYLWDGLPLVPVTLGLFALPELIDLGIRRASIASSAPENTALAGQWQGIRDVFRHWWLVLRCSWLGAALGAVPGIGSAVIDWVAYGHAARSEKNTESFGHGDIRGVIASESSNNAKSGGALVPTIAFGVPGSASMALLLGAFVMHGLVPGPEMLTRHLDVTYAIIWSLAFANVLGSGICLFGSNLFARVALIRYGVLLPIVFAVVFVGAFQGSRSWGDLYTLLIFGAFGWIMKRFGWPRPPLILGFVLGEIFERYLFISVERYGLDWLMRPVVIAIFALALWGMYHPLKRALRGQLRGAARARLSHLRFGWSEAFTSLVLLVITFALVRSVGWPDDAARVPQTAGAVALLCALGSLAVQLFSGQSAKPDTAAPAAGTVSDLQSSLEGIAPAVMVRRAANLFVWLGSFLALIAVTGFLPAILVFLVTFMIIEGKERVKLAMPLALGITFFCWLVFDRVLALPWPQAILGDLLPPLRAATGFL
jgi:TctA family transporter